MSNVPPNGLLRIEIKHLKAVNADLLNELERLVMLIEPLEREGGMKIPGLATLNGARAAIAKAKAP